MCRNLALALILVVHAVLLTVLSFSDSPTNIEIAHLPSGLSHWEHGTFYYFKQNPPLVRLVASWPISLIPHETNWRSFSDDKRLRCELAVGSDFLEANRGKIPLLYGLARIACIPFSLLGACICYFWAKDLWGYAAGLIALLLWCFSPMILGHGHLLNPDVAAAAMGVTAAYSFRNWFKRKTLERAIIAGVLCGLSILTKSTWIFLLVLWPILYMIIRLFKLQNNNQCFIKKDWLHICVILLTAIFLVNLFYGFEGSFKPLGQYQFVSKTLSDNVPSKSGALKLGNRFSDRILGYVPVPFPSYFVEGLDIQKSDFESPWDSYLQGEWKQGGWWYYYFYGMAVKTPETTLLLFFMAAGVTLCSHHVRLPVWESLFIVMPGLLIIGVCTLQSNMSVHYRYVIPTFPFLYVFISRVGIVFRDQRILSKVFVGIFCGCSIAMTLWNYPHYISYFNFVSGGPNNGYRHMQASSLDWGQDSYRLKKWQEKHPDSNPLFIALYSYVKPEWLGIKGKPVIQMVQQIEDFDPEALESGWFAISRCHTYGNELNFSFFDSFTPITTIGNTIDIFYLSKSDVAWYKNQARIYNELHDNLVDWLETNSKVKVAVYCHDDSDTGHIDQIITTILNESSGFHTSLIDAEAIKKGALAQFNVVLFPGGSGTATRELLGREGLDCVTDFVQSGGGYVGICGGAYLASGGYGLEFIDTRASLEDVVENGKTVSMADRGFGHVQMKTNRIGRKLFNNAPAVSQVLFSGGPIFTSLIGKRSDMLVLALYESEICEYDCQKGSMIHSPAIVASRVGNGLCVSISPHPEASEQQITFVWDSVRMVAPRPKKLGVSLVR